jgi:peroxiredoxin
MSPGSLLSHLPRPIKDAIKEHVQPRPLAEGEIIPEWHLQAADGTWHRQGLHWSVMAFLPPCPEHEALRTLLPDLQAHQARLLELGARVFVVIPAEAPELKAIAANLKVDLPLLTDRGASVSRMFRAAIQLPLRPMVIPTVYLVNPERRIRLANRGTPSMEAVVRSIEALKQATREGM